MTETVYSPVSYLIVLAILLVLTVVTVAVSFAPLEGVWHIVCGLVIAAIKGGLVVVFFMHALHGSAVKRIWIAIALVWLVVLFSLSFSDYFTRDLVPYMPGH